MEHEEIKIEKVRNGYLIIHKGWVEDTCANFEHKYVAESIEMIEPIVTAVLSGEYVGNFYCEITRPDGGGKCTFPDNDHDNHPKG